MKIQRSYKQEFVPQDMSDLICIVTSGCVLIRIEFSSKTKHFHEQVEITDMYMLNCIHYVLYTYVHFKNVQSTLPFNCIPYKIS